MNIDLGPALDAMKAAERGYSKAKAYSEGPINEVFASRRVRRLLRDKGVSFQTVLGDIVIDAVADKLVIESITSDSDSRTALIAVVDDDNAMALVRPAVMRRALQLGDSYLTAWPALDDNGDVLPGKVRVDVHSPQTMRVLYDDENTTQPKVAIQKWSVGKRVRVDLIYSDRIEHFITRVDNGNSTRTTDFMPYTNDGQDAVEDNPYGFPVFHFHGQGLPGEYGCPEHKGFYGTQDKLMKLTIGHMSSVDFHTLPQRVALREAGAAASSPDQLDEDEYLTDPTGAKTETLAGDAKATLSSEPGSLWDLTGYKDVKQLEPGDPSVFLDPMQAYLREGALATSTPLWAFDRTGQIPSGESLKTANGPLDSKSGSRKMSFNSTWRAFYGFVLSLLGEDNAPAALAWAPIESTDETTKLSQAAQKQELGVPVDQSLSELGYKPDLIAKWFEDGDGGLPGQVALLAELGNAVASFSTAVAAGILDQSIVQQVVAKVMGSISDDRPD